MLCLKTLKNRVKPEYDHVISLVFVPIEPNEKLTPLAGSITILRGHRKRRGVNL